MNRPWILLVASVALGACSPGESNGGLGDAGTGGSTSLTTDTSAGVTTGTSTGAATATTTGTSTTTGTTGVGTTAGDPDAAVVVNLCVPPTGGPTMHRNSINADETWTAAGSPHIVSTGVSIYSGTLTIEPCAEVRLGAGVYVMTHAASASIVALGTAERPIRMGRADSTKPWSSVYGGYGGTLKLAYVSLDSGGSDGAGLAGSGSTLLDHITIAGSASAGLAMEYGATFAAGSQALTITGSVGRAAIVNTTAVANLPTGSYTGNQIDEIELRDSSTGATFNQDTIVPALGVPYASINGFKVAAAPTGQPRFTVTFAAGNTLLLGAGAGVGATAGVVDFAGTAERPIRIARLVADKPWATLRGGEGGQVRLSHATVEGGGGTDQLNTNPGAMITATLFNGYMLPAVDALHVDQVTLKDSVTAGLGMQCGARFTAGSRGLHITGSATIPIGMCASGFSNLPDGSYTGNAQDQISLSGSWSGTISEDVTIHARDVPYVVDGVDIEGVKSNLPLVTIEPGVTIKFRKAGLLRINSFGTVEGQGSLSAVGTPDKPIVFTSAQDLPTLGDWGAIYYKGIVDARNRIDFARIEYAGGPGPSIAGYTCKPTGTDELAALIFLGPSAPPAFVTNTTFSHIAGHGVMRDWTDGTDVDFLTTNTFTDVTECKQTFVHSPSVSCSTFLQTAPSCQ